LILKLQRKVHETLHGETYLAKDQISAIKVTKNNSRKSNKVLLSATVAATRLIARCCKTLSLLLGTSYYVSSHPEQLQVLF